MPNALVWILAWLAAVAPVAARADDDLPDIVGRVADFAGQLYLSAQDRPDDWMPIGINYPVTSGDNLWVSGDGRAEVDYGTGQIRLAGDTNLNVSRLEDRQLTLFVARGRLIVRVRVLDAGDVARIDTPNTQVVLTRPGLYRIDVAPDGLATTVNVREGESLIGITTGAQQTLAGQAATVVGIDPIAADVRNAPGGDGFDAWSANRDRYYERGRAAAYVPRQMVGSAELDEYGSWEGDATYGPVWYPADVAADWAPYRDGYWTDVGAWGLTWVDSAPWGYAPTHYGRWVHVGNRWGWCPGAHGGRPRWAPALVGWYGGASWGFTANAGAPVYGWVPLGWGDVYRPWWRGCSQTCWNRYNRPYGVRADDRPNGPPPRYSHMGVPGAMTAVAGATLVGRKPVRANMVALPASQIASPPLLSTAPSVAPGAGTAAVVRPGERGTPTPASVLYSHARRNPVVAVPAARSVTPRAGGPDSAGAGMSPAGRSHAIAPAIRPAPAASASVPPASPVSPSGAPAATPGGSVARGATAVPGGSAAQGAVVVHGGATAKAGAAAHGAVPVQGAVAVQGGATMTGGAPPPGGATVKGGAAPQAGPPRQASPAMPVGTPPASQSTIAGPRESYAPRATAQSGASLAPSASHPQASPAGSPGASGMALPPPSTVAPSPVVPAARPAQGTLQAHPGTSTGVPLPTGMTPPVIVAPPVVALPQGVVVPSGVVAPPVNARGRTAGDSDAAKDARPADRNQPGPPTQR